MVAVAQSAERLVVVQEVAGSNPVSHPTDGEPSAPLSPSQGSKRRCHLSGAGLLRTAMASAFPPAPRQMSSALTATPLPAEQVLDALTTTLRESPSHATPRLPTRPGRRNRRLPQRLQHRTTGGPLHLTGLVPDAGLTPGLRVTLPHALADPLPQPAPPSGRSTTTSRAQSCGLAHHRPAGERRQRRGHHHRRRRRLLSRGRLPGLRQGLRSPPDLLRHRLLSELDRQPGQDEAPGGIRADSAGEPHLDAPRPDDAFGGRDHRRAHPVREPAAQHLRCHRRPLHPAPLRRPQLLHRLGLRQDRLHDHDHVVRLLRRLRTAHAGGPSR